jgi:hypothetical protein
MDALQILVATPVRKAILKRLLGQSSQRYFLRDKSIQGINEESLLQA